MRSDDHRELRSRNVMHRQCCLPVTGRWRCEGGKCMNHQPDRSIRTPMISGCARVPGSLALD